MSQTPDIRSRRNESEPTAFVAQSMHADAETLYFLIQEAGLEAGVRVGRYSDINPDAGSILDSIEAHLRSADLVIFDLTADSLNVVYEFGFCQALQKNTMVIWSDLNIGIRLEVTERSLRYDRDNPSVFKDRLARLIADAIANPAAFKRTTAIAPLTKRLFVSYSHQDIAYLSRLLIHLRPLEKQGLIDSWVDSKIEPGTRWKEELERTLSLSSVAILLISADYLASDFIVDNELPPILARAAIAGTRIIPIIVGPCRFGRDERLNVFQAINDPRQPVSRMTPSEQEELYDKVAQAVEREIGRMS